MLRIQRNKIKAQIEVSQIYFKPIPTNISGLDLNLFELLRKIITNIFLSDI